MVLTLQVPWGRSPALRHSPQKKSCIDDSARPRLPSLGAPLLQGAAAGNKTMREAISPKNGRQLISPTSAQPVSPGFIGLIIVIGAQVAAVAQGAFMQYQSSMAEHPLNNPYLTCWWNHSVTWLFAGLVTIIVLRRRGMGWMELLSEGPYGVGKSDKNSIWRSACVDAVLFAILYKYNVLWAESLSQVPVMVFCCFASSSSVVTLLYSWIFLSERLSFTKFLACALVLFGVLLVSYSTEAESVNGRASGTSGMTATTPKGMLWALAYTLFLSGFTMTWKLRPIGSADTLTTGLIMGLMGVVNVMICWLPMCVPTLWGSQLEFPTSLAQARLLIINSVLGIGGNCLFTMGCTLAHPLISTAGVALQIPLAVVADLFLHSSLPSLVAGIGALITCVGFGTLSWLKIEDVGAKAKPVDQQSQDHNSLSWIKIEDAEAQDES